MDNLLAQGSVEIRRHGKCFEVEIERCKPDLSSYRTARIRSENGLKVARGQAVNGES